MRAFDVATRCAQPDRLAGLPLDLLDDGVGLDFDSLVAEKLLHRLGDVWIFARNQRVGSLDDRDAAAETPECLRQFQPHVAAAKHDQVLGHFAQFQGLDMRQRACIGKPRRVVDAGPRTRY